MLTHYKTIKEDLEFRGVRLVKFHIISLEGTNISFDSRLR